MDPERISVWNHVDAELQRKALCLSERPDIRITRGERHVHLCPRGNGDRVDQPVPTRPLWTDVPQLQQRWAATGAVDRRDVNGRIWSVHEWSKRDNPAARRHSPGEFS